MKAHRKDDITQASTFPSQGLCFCHHSGMFSPRDLKHSPTDIPIVCFFVSFRPLLKGHLLVNTFLATSLELQLPFPLQLNCYFNYFSYVLLDFLYCCVLSIRARSLSVFFSLVFPASENGFRNMQASKFLIGSILLIDIF